MFPDSLKKLNCYCNRFIAKDDSEKEYQKYIQKIIYSIHQDHNIFIDNLIEEFGFECYKCKQTFICFEKYRFIKCNNQEIPFVNRCQRCSSKN